jgi:hypothetical protein
MYVLTAVIPVHGVSRNLENLKKMFKLIPSDIQVIVVHDTTDGEDATQLAKLATSSNFTILEGAGGSAGETRNHALPVINSEWTVFWDADDCPHPISILEAISDATCDEIDLIVGSFSLRNQKEMNQGETKRKSTGIKVHESFLTEFGIWRCVFRTAKIKNISFNELKIGEDLAFILAALPNSIRSVYFSSRNVYEYTQNSNGSVTNSILLNNDFEKAIQKISNLKVEGEFKDKFKSQIILSLLLSQFKRFPSARKLSNLIKFCAHNPVATYNKAQELRRK